MNEWPQIYMSQQTRRFTSAAPRTAAQSPSPARSDVPPPFPIATQNSENRDNASGQTSTLAQAPANFEVEDLTIHIDAAGRKRLVNPQGEESMIQPFANKYFGDYKRGGKDSVGEHNRRASIEDLKDRYFRSFRVSPTSKIYNYHTREIHLLSQYYQNMISEREKQEIIAEYGELKGRFQRVKFITLGYTIFYLGTRRMAWARLTTSLSTTVAFYLAGATMWVKNSIDLGAFEVRSVMEHSKTYENLLEAYEKDYNIVY